MKTMKEALSTAIVCTGFAAFSAAVLTVASLLAALFAEPALAGVF